MAFRASTLAFVCLAGAPGALGKSPCSDAWQNCSETMCCSTPYFQCVEKNEATTKDGKFMPAYAQCRFANETAGKSSCPCKNPPCIDYDGDWKQKGPKLPWTCVTLTGGCSPAFKPCGPGQNLNKIQKKTWNAGPPCCQWGCTCNYTMDWNAMCQPPKGLYACTKDAQKTTKHENPAPKQKAKKELKDDDNKDHDDDDDDDSSSRLYSVSSDEAPHLHRAGSFPWLAAGASVALVVTGVVMILRKRRIERGSYNENHIFTEADTESS